MAISEIGGIVRERNVVRLTASGAVSMGTLGRRVSSGTAATQNAVDVPYCLFLEDAASGEEVSALLFPFNNCAVEILSNGDIAAGDELSPDGAGGVKADGNLPLFLAEEAIDSESGATGAAGQRVNAVMHPSVGFPGGLKVAVSGVDGEDGTAAVTLQVTDQFGNALGGRWRLLVSANLTAAYGAAADIGDLAATTGVIQGEPLADGSFIVDTGSAGAFVGTHTRAADGTTYFDCVVLGPINGSGSVAVTGN